MGINVALAAFVCGTIGWLITAFLVSSGNGFWAGALVGAVLYFLGKIKEKAVGFSTSDEQSRSPRAID